MHIAMSSLQGDRDKKMYAGKYEHWEKLSACPKRALFGNQVGVCKCIPSMKGW